MRPFASRSTVANISFICAPVTGCGGTPAASRLATVGSSVVVVFGVDLTGAAPTAKSLYNYDCNKYLNLIVIEKLSIKLGYYSHKIDLVNRQIEI
jgi:glycine cleavage system regulatory protein